MHSLGMWFDRHHVKGLLALGIGACAILGHGVRIGADPVNYKIISGPAAVMIGIVLCGIGVWFVTSP